MQNIPSKHDQIKTFAPTASLSMRISAIALGISAVDMHGLTVKETQVKLRRAANTLMDIALSFDEVK